MKNRILLLEDEENIKNLLSLNLEMEGYTVQAVSDGAKAISLFASENFDLCILDIMVPLVDGISVCENIRIKNEDVPVLFLSAKNTGDDRIIGLKAGADDYITKPFELEELILKVRRLLKKKERAQAISNGKPQRVVTFGKNSINLENFEASGVNGPFRLTRKQADLMKLFVENNDGYITRERILHAVWGYSVYPTTRTIDNFVMALRKNFEEDISSPKHFHTLRGVGYRFTLEESGVSA